MRSSCISHRPRQFLVVVRQDYYELTQDCVAAALLNIFEYWANAQEATTTEVSPWLGAKAIAKFEEMLLGMATDKRIRSRLKLLEKSGFIESRQPVKHRKTLEYRFLTDRVQAALNNLTGKPNGDLTVGNDESQRSFDRKPNGDLTAGNDESQRSFDRCTIYKKDLEDQKKEEEEAKSAFSVDGKTEATKELIANQYELRAENIFDSEEIEVIDLEFTDLENVDSEKLTLVNLNMGEDQSYPSPENLKKEIFRQIEFASFNCSARPWVQPIGVGYLDEMINAVYESNRQWYSLSNGTPNRKQIVAKLKKLEDSLRRLDDQAISAWQELNDYWMVAVISRPEIQEIKKEHEKSQNKALQWLKQFS